MRLTRIYQPQALSSGQVVNLSKEATAHLIRVLRLSLGAEFILFNGQGGEFKAKIVALHKDSASAQLSSYDAVTRESFLDMTLVQAVLRPEKMDYVLQKAVELGITRFVPLLAERSTVRLTPERWQKRYLHWCGVMLSACEQSGRTQLVHLEPPLSLEEGLSSIKAEKRFILVPQATQTLRSPSFSLAQPSIAVLIGPEGGWSENEVNYAVAAGYTPLKIGPRTLRAETAGLAVLSILQSLFGDM